MSSEPNPAGSNQDHVIGGSHVQFTSGLDGILMSRPFLDSLAPEAGDDRLFQKELATAYERVASVQGEPGSHSLGQYEQSEKARRRR